MNIEVMRGDITTLAVDAIVNAANSALLGGGGVDGAIHRAAGPGLLAECRGLGGCPVGEVRVTRGYDLPTRFVIHAVGPVWHGGGCGEPGLLASCYHNALIAAQVRDLSSIAFPAISTGAFGYPAEDAAAVAVGALINADRHGTGLHRALPERAILVAFDAESETILRAALERLCADGCDK